MRRLFASFVLLIFIFSFYACEKKKEILGEWRTYDIGVDIDSPEVPDYLTFVFKGDGTGSGPVSDFQRLDWPTFTYEIRGDIIYAHTDDDRDIQMKYSLYGDSMTLEYDGYTRTLHRVS